MRAGITTVFIPKENEKDLAEIPDNVKKRLKIIPVADVDEVIAQALARRPEAIEWEEPPEPVAPPPQEQPPRFAAALITCLWKARRRDPAGLSAVIDAAETAPLVSRRPVGLRAGATSLHRIERD